MVHADSVFPGNSDIWPVHSPNGNDFQGFPKNFDQVYYSNPNMFSPTASDLSVSNFYYQQSRTGEGEPFRVTYQFFPHRINVPILPGDENDNNYFYKFVNRAYDTIQARYSDANWYNYFAQFDQRTTSDYQFDNSVNPIPDGKIDYLLILFRFNSPPSGQHGWMNSIGRDAYAGVTGRTFTFSNGNTIAFSGGFTVQKGLKGIDSYKSLFIHEDGHTFYNGPHVFGANGVVGQYFYTGNGWGGVASQPRIYYSYNAWDRWWLDWIDIKHDLNGVQHNGEYWLRDFITTGDAMRLKLPTPDGQYVWLENRTGHTPFDKRLGLARDGAQNPIPPSSKGVVAFVEAISDNQTSVSIFVKGANALRAINPNGNFDYSWTTYRAGEQAPEWWGNRIYNYTTKEPNPFSAHNSLMALRDDFFGDSIHFPPNGVISVDDNPDSPNKHKKEMFSVLELDGEVTWGPTGYNIAFEQGKKISISTNPGLIAQQKYNKPTEKLNPIYLHGLSVQVVNYTGTGVNRKAKIKVKYDDYLVDRDVRWCGDIILPMGVPLELKETKSITLDKSGTPNRHTQTTAGDFINPTVLTFEEGATFVLRTNSNMYVRGGSTLHLKPNSKLTIAGGAKLYIRPNSFLQIDDCAELEVLPGGKVIVETAGVLQISHQAILNVHDGQAAFNLNNAAIIPQGFVNPSADVPPAYRINDGVHEWNGAAYKMYRNLVLEPGAKVTLNGTSLSFPKDSGIVVKPRAQLNVNGGTLTNFTGCGFTGLWRGIRVEGLPRAPHTEEYQGFLSIGPGTTISHAEVGVRVSNMNVADGGGILKVVGATFVDNIVGIRFDPYHSPNQSRVSNSTFTTTGYMAQQGIIPKWFIELNRITPVAIRDNTFHNTSPESYSLTDRGYGVMAQDADVCIDTKFVANTFTNLFTAVNAVSTRDVPSLTVRGAIITDCFNGIHVSGYPTPVVEHCNIHLPYEAYQDRVPTGISAEALNSISFTGNAIMGNGMGYGIFLNDRVGLSGIIGENLLDYLQVGVMAASGEPSHVPGFTSSVQLQCNWFSDNLLADIYVTGNGVANEQGTKRISASNRFMKAPDYNIFSSTMPLTYYAYRNDFFPPACNDKVVVLEAERLADCGIIIPLRGMEDIARYNDSLNLACDMLLALQDLGETSALVETVEGEENPLILRNVLLRSSPLLSDTVMVTASDDAVPLPNLMLAQVLMSNPQAAKSAAVLQALNERENTLPDYLMEAIHDAGSGYSPIDGAKSEIAFHRVNRDILAGRLLARFTADTLGKPYDSIRMLPDYHPDRIYRYLSAFTHVEQGNHEEALAALQSMAGEPGLTPGELQETEGVTRLVNILAGLEQAGIPLELMDSDARATIEEMATQGVGLAALLAGNVLVIADRIPFLAQELALGDAHSGSHSGEWSILLELEPYPVTDYVVAVYDMGSKPCRTPRISVVNSKGDVMYNELLTRSRFQILVEVEGWNPGTYTVQLADGELVLAQRSFLIMGHDGGSESEKSETHELLSNAGISIHPNPTDGQFTIEVRGCGGECRFAYEVIDPSGTTLLTGNGNTSKALSLSHLSKGTYLVVVTLGGERLVQPVVLR